MLPRLQMLLAAVLVCAPAFAAEWLTSWPAACNKAKAEHKLVLMDFTGSDWCGACVRLRREIFDTPAFEAYAKDRFVCLEVDRPRTKALPAALETQNAGLCRDYGVRVFPTILVTDPKGELVGGFMGSRDSFAKVKEPLDRAVKSAKNLRKAAALKGEKRAAALFAVWASVPADLRTHSQAMREEILRLDPHGRTGMGAELKAEAQKKAFEADAKAAKDADDLLRVANEYYRVALPQNKLEIARLRAVLMYYACETVEDVVATGKATKEVLEMDPAVDDAERASLMEDYRNPAALLEKITAERRAAEEEKKKHAAP